MFDPFDLSCENEKNIPKKKVKKFQKIIISNIEIFFPYVPNESQIKYMQKIIVNLNQKFLNKSYKSLCALESPSGTKNILCILSSCLAWIYDMKKTRSFNGKIFFVVKNYKKISKIIKKLNLIYYKPNICVLFSPSESCINNDINKYCKNDIIFHKCKNNEKKIYCEFYNKNNEIKNEYLSIEEFNNFICSSNICPFLYEKQKFENSDIIFITYENFCDKNMKKYYQYDTKDNIIIFDESEMLEKICENYNSIYISISDFENIKKILIELCNNKNFENILNREYNKMNNVPNINDIKSEIINIDKIISNILLYKEKIFSGEVYPNKGLLLKNKEFLGLFLTKNNTKINDMQYITLDNIKNHILLLINIEKLINLFFYKNSKIDIFIAVLEKIYNFYINQNNNIIDSYNFFLFFEKNEKNEKKNIKLNIYCFEPNIAFNDLILNEKYYSYFFMSKYFGAFDLIQNEFKIKFDIILQNNSIYNKDFYKFNIIQSTLYQQEKINFNLDENMNNNDTNIKIVLGYTLLSLCYSNPYGNILVLFPSMTYLYQCNTLWKCEENNIFNKISNKKKIIFFQKFNEFNEKNSDFNEKKSKIFFTEFDINIYKIKNLIKTEKINMIIILGLPQNQINFFNFDDKIQLKMNYINKKNILIAKTKKNVSYYDEYSDDITSEKWYEKNIMVPINIFILKCLKLIQGIGSIICIDERYSNFYKNNNFCWLLKNYGEIIDINNRNYFDNLSTFYNKIKNKFYQIIDNNDINIINEEIFDINDINDIDEEDNNINNDIENKENFFIFKEYNNNKIFNNINNNNDLLNNEDIINNTNELLNNDDNINNEDNMESLLLYNEEEENINNNTKNNISNGKIGMIKENNINTKELINKKHRRINNDENENLNNKKIKNSNNIYNTIIYNNNIENIQENNNEQNNNEVEYELNMELYEQLNKNDFTEKSDEIFECPICFKKSDENNDLIYSRSKCKHVLCNICWCSWFSEKFECPICKAKARPKTLKRIIFI